MWVVKLSIKWIGPTRDSNLTHFYYHFWLETKLICDLLSHQFFYSIDDVYLLTSIVKRHKRERCKCIGDDDQWSRILGLAFVALFNFHSVWLNFYLIDFNIKIFFFFFFLFTKLIPILWISWSILSPSCQCH